MVKNKNSDFFRKKAEELLNINMPESRSKLSDEETLKLIHELEIHHIELELQNDELRLAQSAAQVASEKYIELYDFAPSGYVTLSSTSEIVKLNHACAKMIGKERSRLINAIMLLFISDDTKQEFLNFLQRTINGISKETCQAVLISDTISPVYVHFEGIASLDGRHCLATMIDITSEINSQKSLEKLIRQKNLILEAAGEGIYGVDLDGRNTFVNPYALDVFGYNINELLNKDSHAVFHHHYPDGTLFPMDDCPIQATLLSGKPYDGEGYFWRKNGTCFPVEFSSHPIIDDLIISGAVVTFRDITIKKQAEEGMLLLKTVVESSDEAIALSNRDGELIYINPAHEKLFGRPLEEARRMNYRDFYPPESIDILNHIVSPALERGESWEGEIDVFDKSGRRFPLWERAGVIPDSNGKMLYGYGFMHDISDRVNAAKKLKRNEEVYRLITERSNDLIFVFRLKPEIGFEYVSPSAEIITGYTPEDHYNDPQLGIKLVHPDDLHFLETMQNGLVNQEIIKLRWIKKDGSIIWTESQNIPVYNDDGELTAIQGKSTDITKRIQAEEILRARLRILEFYLSHTREELQQNLLDELEILTESKIGFFHVVEPDQKTLKLQSWSTRTIQTMCSAAGKGEHYSIDKAGVWVDCFYQKKPVVHNDYASLSHKKGMPEGHAPVFRELVVPIIRNDNVVAIVGVGNKQIDYNERDIEIVSLLSDMAWDITERKGAEEELRLVNAELEQRVKERTEQLTAAYKDIESFAYSISHDLRAPLRHISGFIGLLKEMRKEQSTPEELKYIDTIFNGAVEMGSLIDALLSFSRLNRAELHKAIINTSDIVNQVINLLEQDIKERKIIFKTSNLADCEGDEQLIRQVWINLISNAIKYTGKKEEAIIEIGSRSQKNEIVFFIKDNGAGFDMKYSGKMFGVFQRMHKASDFEGIGIGLAIVNSIITRHNGYCTAEGEVDKGATFSFTLPKKQ